MRFLTLSKLLNFLEKELPTELASLTKLKDVYLEHNAFRGKVPTQLAELTPKFRQRIADGESLDDLLPEAFAAAREVGKRVLREGRHLRKRRRNCAFRRAIA